MGTSGIGGPKFWKWEVNSIDDEWTCWFCSWKFIIKGNIDTLLGGIFIWLVHCCN
jgi:hypothetical protein